ncbi:MAG: PASTA domain-containing protein, partial [Actinobacteria bacterium]|nr:PASTA domain-containing protein [Actinomycetota bacterium]
MISFLGLDVTLDQAVAAFGEQYAPGLRHFTADADDLLEEYEEDYSLHLEVKEVRDYREAGTVVGQRPKPDTGVAAGKLVTLRVSNGKGRPPRVPDVVGMHEDRARKVLEDADYEVSVEEQERKLIEGDEPPQRERTVIRMSPEAGTPLEPEEEVVITVVVYDVRPAPDDDDEQQQP